MDCRQFRLKTGAPRDTRCIVLAGNPNVGKSVVYNGLTGTYVDVSNFPGTTLEINFGRTERDVLIDTPGVYGISSFTQEEKVTRDLILSADLVINVVDAAHLERDLFLTQHIIDAGVPMVVALNMMDECGRLGLEVNPVLLESLLGVPVIPMVAVEKKGFKELKKRLGEARVGNSYPELQVRLQKLALVLGNSQGEALMMLEEDPSVAVKAGLTSGNERDNIYFARRERVNEIFALVVREVGPGVDFSVRLGHWMLNPLTGIPLLAVALFVIYELVGVFFAQVVVEFTEGVVMSGYYEPFVRNLLSRFMDLGSPLGIILAGQFGLLTMTFTYVIGLLTPLVLGFYLVLSLLEDSGYLPRIATLVDRLLAGLGLNGQAIIPLILGFGCVTMASITTRLLPSDRERRIAIFLLALAVPCSAQLAFVATILAGMGPSYLMLYVLLVFSILVGVGSLMARFLPGYSSPLLIDLPPLRLPRVENVFTKAFIRSWQFLKEAFPLFAGGTLFLSVLKVTGLLEVIQNILQPLTVGWLHLPREAANAFVMGFIRRDFGTAGILSLPMTTIQQFVALVTLTLFVPCIASTMVIFKERGWREGLIMWPTIFLLAFLVGGVVAHLFDFFGSWGQVSTVPMVAGVIFLFLAVALALGRPGNRST